MKTSRAVIVAFVLLALCVQQYTAQQALMNLAMGMLQNYFSSQLSIAGLLLQFLTAGASSAFGALGKRDLSSTASGEEYHSEDVYLNVIRTLDEKDCIASLLCNVAKVPRRYKSFGADVYAYFKKHAFDDSSSAMHYKKAFEKGLRGGDCTVSACGADIVLLGDLLGRLRS
ncbi:unnamed protein product [Ixodes persulcatus]